MAKVGCSLVPKVASAVGPRRAATVGQSGQVLNSISSCGLRTSNTECSDEEAYLRTTRGVPTSNEDANIR